MSKTRPAGTTKKWTDMLKTKYDEWVKEHPYATYGEREAYKEGLFEGYLIVSD